MVKPINIHSLGSWVKTYLLMLPCFFFFSWKWKWWFGVAQSELHYHEEHARTSAKLFLYKHLENKKQLIFTPNIDTWLKLRSATLLHHYVTRQSEPLWSYIDSQVVSQVVDIVSRDIHVNCDENFTLQSYCCELCKQWGWDILTSRSNHAEDTTIWQDYLLDKSTQAALSIRGSQKRKIRQKMVTWVLKVCLQ